MSFSPIAIVGRGCVLPGANSPAALWDLILRGESAVSDAGLTDWRAEPRRFLADATRGTPGRVSTIRAGHVRDFDAVFDPRGFQWPADAIASAEVTLKWPLHAGRQALTEAGYEPGSGLPVGGVVMGNLSYPTEGYSTFSRAIWLARQEGSSGQNDSIDPGLASDRFSSGLPIKLMARALGLSQGGMALDAACASTLYAIKIACDRLQDGRADLMLAGGVTASGPLFLQLGFQALGALSRTGRTRPFHRGGDGLIPGRGTAVVALRRLEDALADGQTILGIIRGIGLSNDGMGGGFLSPDARGQCRAMENAYRVSGIDRSTISLVECHATGTPLGDATEIQSMSQVFSESQGLPIGSLKANLGHILAAAGGAAMLKVLGAFQAGVRPATPGIDEPLRELSGSPFRVLTAAEPWDVKGPRRAGINAFGFGGNNAHVIVEEWSEQRKTSVAVPNTPAPKPVDLAVVAINVWAAGGRGWNDFVRHLLVEDPTPSDLSGGEKGFPMGSLQVDATALRTPPYELLDTLGQQTILKLVGLEIMAGLALPLERTAVFVGMGCDPEATRCGPRNRCPEDAPDAYLDAWDRPFTAARVKGMMPNIPANQLNRLFGFQGPGFTVSAEEVSGLAALELARRGLAAGEFDAAMVGAIDLSCDPVHQAAAKTEFPANRQVAGDAAVILVVERLADAQAAGREIVAILPAETGEESSQKLVLDAAEAGLSPRFGHAHAASGLLMVAAGVAACTHAARPAATGLASPWLQRAERRTFDVEVESLTGERHSVRIAAAPRSRARPVPVRTIEFRFYAAHDLAGLASRIERDEVGGEGPVRLAFVAKSEENAERYRRNVLKALRDGTSPAIPGVRFSDKPLAGDVAFLFTGVAAGYPNVGRELLLAIPEMWESEVEQHTSRILDGLSATLYPAPGATPSLAERGLATTAITHFHTRWTREILEIQPQASVPVSLGEVNSLMNLGVWDKDESVFFDLFNPEIAEIQIGGEFRSVRRYWESRGWLKPGEPIQYTVWQVRHPVERVIAAVEAEPRIRVTIIFAADECCISGQEEDCKRLISQLKASAMQVDYPMAVHCPELSDAAELWRKVFHRPVRAVPEIRFYSNTTNAAFEPTADGFADLYTHQALNPVDFSKTVQQAWQDGVRLFIEHGPRGQLTSAIGRTFAGQRHVAVALDAYHRPPLLQILDATVQLWVAGVPLNIDRCLSIVSRFRARPESSANQADDGASRNPGILMTLPARLPDVRLPVEWIPHAMSELSRPEPDRSANPIKTESESQVSEMPLAPWLPSVLSTPAEPIAAAATAELPPEAPDQPQVEPDFPNGWPVPQRFAEQPVLDLSASVSRVHHSWLVSMAESQTAFLKTVQSVTANYREPGAPRGEGGDRGVTSFAPASHGVSTGPANYLDRGHSYDDATAHASTTATLAPASAASNFAGQAAVVEATPIAVVERPAPPARAPFVPKKRNREDTSLNREELEYLSHGRISEIFGPLFEQQDEFDVQVRMPMPPLLLADRVVEIRADAGKLGTGMIITETDVRADSWYLHADRIPPGVMIETGQADLLLISYMGIDFLTRGTRRYRLLGCDLTYHGPLAKPGETLRFEIAIDGHARTGNVRLFFFHYDCYVNGELRMKVRNGQAGFFTEEELNDSDGILWDPAQQTLTDIPRVDPPRVAHGKTSLSQAEVEQFAAGDLFGCFGPGFELAASHTRTPGIPTGDMMLIHRVTAIDYEGGPWKRGYLRAEFDVTPDSWFFPPHFKNDPCMPGTLMFDGCVQAMAVYMASLGFTIDKDGWRFEPVLDQVLELRCRGQVTPTSRLVTCEIFVSQVIDGDEPRIIADMLGSVDGVKAFHGKSIGLRLVPAWPLEDAALPAEREPARIAHCGDVRGDYSALIACALGQPSTAFGAMYERFDGAYGAPRLPGEPYHFMSRITQMPAQANTMKAGESVEVEFDVDPAAWYFTDNGNPAMPFAVLTEVALQPCGWLASFTGCAVRADGQVAFRNLDGVGTVHGSVTPNGGRVTVRSQMTSLSPAGKTTIVGFAVECRQGDRPIFSLETKFGFFPPKALISQVGLTAPAEARAIFDARANCAIDLRNRPADYFQRSCRLPGGQLLMLDRVTFLDPRGGRAQLGSLRAEKTVQPGEWFFKAHFFQDPVQPGSLGLDAMLQLLQVHMLSTGMDQGFQSPRFEPIAPGPVAWKFRGQVVPTNKVISSTVEITKAGRDDQGAFVLADAYLWVDGMTIYEARGLGMRIRDDRR